MTAMSCSFRICVQLPSSVSGPESLQSGFRIKIPTMAMSLRVKSTDIGPGLRRANGWRTLMFRRSSKPGYETGFTGRQTSAGKAAADLWPKRAFKGSLKGKCC
jgi:hypothetical protein